MTNKTNHVVLASWDYFAELNMFDIAPAGNVSRYPRSFQSKIVKYFSGFHFYMNTEEKKPNLLTVSLSLLTIPH